MKLLGDDTAFAAYIRSIPFDDATDDEIKAWFGSTEEGELTYQGMCLLDIFDNIADFDLGLRIVRIRNDR